MRTMFIVLLLAAMPIAAFAQNTPVGKWHTVDDKTGKVKSTVEIYDAGDGLLSGKVLEILHSDKGPNPVCVPCKGANHDKPITGMVIAWGLKHEGKSWDDGKILDPDNGKVYSAKMTPLDGGTKLEVRGYLGFSLLGRSQTWVRVE